MESNLVYMFSTETNCDVDTAFEYLQSNLWDLHAAIESWKAANNNKEDKFEKNERGEVKKLSRGISRATDNVNLVNRARSEFAEKFTPAFFPKSNWMHMDTPGFSFTLPDFTIYGDEFRKFLEKDLIENSTLVSLEQSGRLNWWVDSGNIQGPFQKLWPLSTTGDGNCLLHAASLAIWGFHDRLLTLRKALHSFLETGKFITALYRRWRWQQTKLNEQSGFDYSEAEWLKEWKNIVSMASVEPRKNGNGATDRSVGGVNLPPTASASTYESLEEIHVLVLAHILRRPIIVVADTMLRDMNNEPFAPIPFGGIYLPMEIQPKDCHRSPLLLTYDMAHFSALVAMESADKESLEKLFACVPLVDSEGVLLPVQFCVDPGIHFNWCLKYEQSFINSLIPTEKEQIALLKRYLDVVDLSENDTVSPEIDSEDEIEKRFVEVTDLGDGETTLFGSKNRAAKQLQSVARQFGSIGKSMSKKLRKNFGSITKTATKPKKNDSRRMLCAEMHHTRHAYQDDMIKNYLIHAQKRFLSTQKDKVDINTDVKLQEQALLEGPLKCINANCDSYGTVLTSYMCEKCFETQRNEELLTINSDSRFGTGRSKFYRDSDIESYDAIKNIPISKSNINPNRTLYLSKSTFYYDNDEDKIDQTPANKTKSSIKTIQVSSTSANEAESNNNANTTIKVPPPPSPEVRHISKFDFGNINESVNRNFISENSSNNLKLSNADLAEYNCVSPSDIILRNQNGLENFKNHSNTYTIYPEDGKYKQHIDSSNAVYHTVNDLNENKDFVQEIIHDCDRDPNNLKEYHFSPAKIKENHCNLPYSVILERCKSNNCPNAASAHTNFYCAACNKKRLAGLSS